jgi:hypothetical protein
MIKLSDLAPRFFKVVRDACTWWLGRYRHTLKESWCQLQGYLGQTNRSF